MKKGEFNKECKRTACNSQVGVINYNDSTREFYCKACANQINYWSSKDSNLVLCNPVKVSQKGDVLCSEVTVNYKGKNYNFLYNQQEETLNLNDYIKQCVERVCLGLV